MTMIYKRKEEDKKLNIKFILKINFLNDTIYQEKQDEIKKRHLPHFP